MNVFLLLLPNNGFNLILSCVCMYKHQREYRWADMCVHSCGGWMSTLGVTLQVPPPAFCDRVSLLGPGTHKLVCATYPVNSLPPPL